VFQGMRGKGSAPVLRLLGQRSGTGTHGDRGHKPAAKNIKCPVATYVITPDIRTRGALHAGVVSFGCVVLYACAEAARQPLHPRAESCARP
jgi:hypothetical protein